MVARSRRVSPLLLFTVLLLVALPTFAQQTGGLTGRVLGPDGAAMPGVTVEARSTVLPQARVVSTSSTGEFRIQALPPGTYTLKFTLAGMQDATRRVEVLLGQDVPVNVTMGLAGVAESITVTAEASLVEQNTTEVKSAVTSELIENLPIGQEYRDLVKLAPAVQYTEDAVRGPSAGGSGQDNVYQFDGVNVTLPLFGTLASDPATHDIQQISVIKGGAKAVDFNRAAGFTIDSVSKSGTSQFKGEVGYQFQTDSMRGDVVGTSVSQYDQNRGWLTANLGGPILADRLFFYGSYYRPTVTRTGRTNAYGPVPDYKSNRDEYFGKLTFTPLSNILINGSYRYSDRTNENASIGSFSTPENATNDSSQQKVAILEASWVLNDRNFISGKYTDYALETMGAPLTILGVNPTTALGTKLDFANPTQYGRFLIPTPVTGATAYNAFIQPIIDKYGYLSNGVKTGGGGIGPYFEINDQDFFRKSGQLAYDVTVGSAMAHDLHVGFMWAQDTEDLIRSSNGWGTLSVAGGRINCPTSATACAGKPYYYLATFTRSALGGVGGNLIHSEYKQQNIEFNDTIRWNNWSFNVGVLASNDTLYGQGLKEDSSTISGYVAAPGHKYEMYDIPWEKTIQPRLGATWTYNGSDNVYASYAKYVPAASSLPRAASWDRSILGLTSRVYFDQDGVAIGTDQVGSSSGKFFVKDMDPRYTDEYLIGTSQQITPRFTARAYARYRYSTNFWEDTNNDARQRWAPSGYPKDLYIADLAAWRAQVGGSSYVIATLDGAFTKHYEATFESDWRGNRTAFKGSYTWSHYYGNFDQDNTSLTSNDSAIFIGSSNLADGVGTQIWDNKYGDLRGDRRHLLKLFGSYALGWNATVGAFGIYQSGQPWEMWSYEPYINIPGFSGLNDVNRYAEPAGSRRSPSHYQVDLTYSQNIPVRGYNLQLQVDAFNVFDNQTGYNYEPSFHSANFGKPRDYFDPRRFQASVKFQF